MIKKIFSLLIGSLLFSYFSFAQQTGTRNSFDLKNIPRELIYTHVNATFLLTGEYLYYKLYCLRANPPGLSNFSKVAYVELVNRDKQTVARSKILLKEGLGEGDFFIADTMATGNYKLVAYTEWMRNNDENKFFQSDISIINPYRTEHDSNNKFGTVTIDTLQNNRTEDISDRVYTRGDQNKSSDIKLILDKTTFAKREKVSLRIGSLKGEKSYGNYSLSVRKKDILNTFERYTTHSYKPIVKQQSIAQTNKLFLPEIRGEIITGRVSFKDSNKPAEKVNVALSVPGSNFIFKTAVSNAAGIFYFNLMHEYGSNEGNVQLLGDDKDKYSIDILEHSSPDYTDLLFPNLQIPPEAKEIILSQSIYNQIENAYKSVKLDSIIDYKGGSVFIKTAQDIEYNLDDYTRFPTIRETIVEVVNNVWISREDDKFTFHVRTLIPDPMSNHVPLLLIDGQLIKDHSILLNYDVNKIKKITVFRDTYIYGPAVIHGIISVETFDGNYRNISYDNNVKRIQFVTAPLNKIYFKQDYELTNQFDRIPDYRVQLYWQPNIELNENEKLIDFFTSDIEGNYEICLEGYTRDGSPVSIIKYIHIKK